MKFYLNILFFLLSLLVAAQKDTSQQLDVKGMENLYIDTDEVFKITVKTTKSDFIAISTHSEGEYFNDISLNTEVKGRSVYLTTQFREILQSGYDKLSAHKVFSLEISLEIPEDLQVFIKSNLASVEVVGDYNFLQVQLNSGYCNLSNFTGNAVVNTYNGAITIKTTGATVTTETRNGKITGSSNFSGKNLIKATSINGNIHVVEN